VDVVEGIGVECPWGGAVFDLEGDVGWDPLALDGGDVGSDYGG